MDASSDGSGIPGVVLRRLVRYEDHRGWLSELFRADELPMGFGPMMGYLSVTHPGVARGPHEHLEQSDGFVFLSGEFELHLWENRPGYPESHEVHRVGETAPIFVIVPPGVVHADRNVGAEDAFVLNFPNRRYRGPGKREPVDEIRHEDDEQSRFKL
jgi:dTDP-4-dehydrorhamnose 3,5-epimerase